MNEKRPSMRIGLIRRIALLALPIMMMLPLVAPVDTFAQQDGGRQRDGDGQQPSLEELKQRFQQRFPQLLAAKREGQIGETHQGYVALVPANQPENNRQLRQLVQAENRDRRQLYRIIAEQEGVTPEVVALHNARRNFEQAESGMYLRGQDGQWYQKSAQQGQQPRQQQLQPQG